MSAFKLNATLLKFKDFSWTGTAFSHGWPLDVLVKPCKNDCRQCGTIARRRSEPEFWRDVLVGPWSVWLMCWLLESVVELTRLRKALHGWVNSIRSFSSNIRLWQQIQFR